MAPVLLRPFNLGELLDRAVNFWRAHWRALFTLMVVFELVQLTVMKLAQAAIRTFFPLLSSAELLSLAEKDPATALPQALGAFAVLMLTVAVVLVVAQVSGVTLSHFGWHRLLGAGALSAADSLRHTAARLPQTLSATALSIAWSLVVMVLLLLPAVGLAAGAGFALAGDSRELAAVLSALAAVALFGGLLVLLLWFILRFVLLSAVLAVEDVSGWRAFRRADTLSSGRVGPGLSGIVKARLTLLVTVMSGVLVIISTVTAVPMVVAGMVYGAGFLPGNTVNDVVPAFVLVPIEVFQTVLGSVVAPLYVVFQLFFYADMRMRREGLDLELKLP